MKVIHYYTGLQVTEGERMEARAHRLEGGHYHFRDVRAWDGRPENCDKIVSDDEAIVSAYKAKGVDVFKGMSKPKAKPKPKKKAEVEAEVDDKPEDASE